MPSNFRSNSQSTPVKRSCVSVAAIEDQSDGSIRIGALVRNGDLAHDSRIQSRYRVLSQAILAGASAQLRNMATTGGNLLQRTRCYYLRAPVHHIHNSR